MPMNGYHLILECLNGMFHDIYPLIFWWYSLKLAMFFYPNFEVIRGFVIKNLFGWSYNFAFRQLFSVSGKPLSLNNTGIVQTWTS